MTKNKESGTVDENWWFKVVPGQNAITLCGGVVYFVASDRFRDPIRYIFADEFGRYFDYDVFGEHATDSDYNIVEILPLEEDL